MFSGTPLKVVFYYTSQTCTARKFHNYVEYIFESFGQFPCIFGCDPNINFSGTSILLFNAIVEYYDFKSCHSFVTQAKSEISIDLQEHAQQNHS